MKFLHRNGRKSRVVPISEDVIHQLRGLMGSHNHDLFFCQEDGSPLSQEHIRGAFQNACKKTGVKAIAFHALRHSFATHFLMHDGALLDLKKLLGHSEVKTTEKYTHLTDDFIASQVSKVHFRRVK